MKKTKIGNWTKMFNACTKMTNDGVYWKLHYLGHREKCSVCIVYIGKPYAVFTLVNLMRCIVTQLLSSVQTISL